MHGVCACRGGAGRFHLGYIVYQDHRNLFCACVHAGWPRGFPSYGSILYNKTIAFFWWVCSCGGVRGLLHSGLSSVTRPSRVFLWVRSCRVAWGLLNSWLSCVTRPSQFFCSRACRGGHGRLLFMVILFNETIANFVVVVYQIV